MSYGEHVLLKKSTSEQLYALVSFGVNGSGVLDSLSLTLLSPINPVSAEKMVSLCSKLSSKVN